MTPAGGMEEASMRASMPVDNKRQGSEERAGRLGVSSDAKDEPKRGAWISNEPASYDPPATHADARAGCPIKTDEARMAESPSKMAVVTATSDSEVSRERGSESPAARWRRSTSVSEVRAVRPTG